MNEPFPPRWTSLGFIVTAVTAAVLLVLGLLLYGGVPIDVNQMR